MAASAATVGLAYPVSVVSIDAEAYDARVRLMKVDVEGYEHDVFAGAKSTILRDRPVIVFEVLNSSKGSAFDALAHELNYRYVIFIGESFPDIPDLCRWHHDELCVLSGRGRVVCVFGPA